MDLVVSIGTGQLGAKGAGMFEEAKVMQAVETVGTITRHGQSTSRRVQSGKESHLGNHAPLAKLVA